LVTTYQTSWSHNPEKKNINLHRRENLKPHYSHDIRDHHGGEYEDYDLPVFDTVWWTCTNVSEESAVSIFRVIEAKREKWYLS
jgi:hypothetical protein